MGFSLQCMSVTTADRGVWYGWSRRRYGLPEALLMLDCCDLGDGGLLSTNVISHSIEWIVARS